MGMLREHKNQPERAPNGQNWHDMSKEKNKVIVLVYHL